MIRGMDLNIYTAAKDGNILDLQRYWQGPLSDIRTVSGDTVLQVHLRDKQSTANIEFMEEIIAIVPSLLSARNDAEDTALHTAARAAQHGAVKLLLERGGGDCIKVLNKDGDTPMHIACREGNLGVVKELLPGNHGVDPDYEYKANHSGETPLHLAVENACREIGETPPHLVFENPSYRIVVQLIAKIPASQHGDPSIGCALHVAASWKNEGFLTMIMVLDPALIRFQDRKGQTPLHYAALKCWPKGMELLLRSDPLAVYCQDNKGRTAAHIAAVCNNVSGLQLLVNLHPDCCEALDNDDQNVAHCAADWGSGEVLKYLFENSHFIDLTYQKDIRGNTPLHLLADSIPRLPNDSVTFMQQSNVIPLVQKLMKPVYDIEQRTPGDIAAKHMHIISELDLPKQDLLRKFMAVAPPSSRNKDLQDHILLSNAVAEEERKRVASTVKSRAKLHMNISLAFTAITAACLIQICSSGPGKFNQNDTDPSNGATSILVSRYSSQAFFIFILISFMVSVLASIFNAMVWFGNGRGFWKLVGGWASFLTVIIAPVFLLMAIMALLYATKRISGISLSIMAVTSGIFVLVCCVIVAGVFRFIIKRERSKLENSLV